MMFHLFKQFCMGGAVILPPPGDDLVSRVSHSTHHQVRSEYVGAGMAGVDKFGEVLRLAESIGLELVEAPRALPVLDEDDYKITKFYVQHFMQKRNALSRGGSFLSRILSGGRGGVDTRAAVAVTEITSASGWQSVHSAITPASSVRWSYLVVACALWQPLQPTPEV